MIHFERHYTSEQSDYGDRHIRSPEELRPGQVVDHNFFDGVSRREIVVAVGKEYADNQAWFPNGFPGDGGFRKRQPEMVDHPGRIITEWGGDVDIRTGTFMTDVGLELTVMPGGSTLGWNRNHLRAVPDEELTPEQHIGSVCVELEHNIRQEFDRIFGDLDSSLEGLAPSQLQS